MYICSVELPKYMFIILKKNTCLLDILN